MSNVKIWWLPFNRLRKGHFGTIGAWQLLRIGGHFQSDYIFIDFLFWSIRIKRTYKENKNEN